MGLYSWGGFWGVGLAVLAFLGWGLGWHRWFGWLANSGVADDLTW